MRQLDLLRDNVGHDRADIDKPTFDWRDGDLVERAGNQIFICGAWRRTFGLWVRESRTGVVRELMPTAPILRLAGVWLPGWHSAVTSEARSRLSNADPNREAVSSAFMSQVPASCRLLAAPFGNYQWLMLDLMNQVPPFAKVLDGLNVIDEMEALAFQMFRQKAFALDRRHRRELATACLRFQGRDVKTLPRPVPGETRKVR